MASKQSTQAPDLFDSQASAYKRDAAERVKTLAMARKVLDKAGLLPLLLTSPRCPDVSAYSDNCTVYLRADESQRASIRESVLQAIEAGKIDPILKSYDVSGSQGSYGLVEYWPVRVGEKVKIQIIFSHQRKMNGEPWRPGDSIPTGCIIQEHYSSSQYGSVACSR